ncbi:unnamed protein product [Ambrosiozyma monospora]|uniref:Unnamed protein product n=1 Tax=Ambrosiozyma monospora TaxID=43982 RepID=A0ACB5TBF7_AMBMO|nr:unnamed protein product [Ambrosiozyma monospora]
MMVKSNHEKPVSTKIGGELNGPQDGMADSDMGQIRTSYESSFGRPYAYTLNNGPIHMNKDQKIKKSSLKAKCYNCEHVTRYSRHERSANFKEDNRTKEPVTKG